jgi:hypothetical protein
MRPELGLHRKYTLILAFFLPLSGFVQQSDQFKDQYRWRAGVEATMSEYDKRTGVKRLRVRGFGAVRFAATLKAAAINIFRATAVRNVTVYA